MSEQHRDDWPDQSGHLAERGRLDDAERPDRVTPVVPLRRVDPAMVERAKGALMLRLGVSSPEALGLLLTWSRDSGTDLRHLCDVLVRGLCRSEPSMRSAEPLLLRWLQTRLQSLENR